MIVGHILHPNINNPRPTHLVGSGVLIMTYTYELAELMNHYYKELKVHQKDLQNEARKSKEI